MHTLISSWWVFHQVKNNQLNVWYRSFTILYLSDVFNSQYGIHKHILFCCLGQAKTDSVANLQKDPWVNMVKDMWSSRSSLNTISEEESKLFLLKCPNVTKSHWLNYEQSSYTKPWLHHWIHYSSVYVLSYIKPSIHLSVLSALKINTIHCFQGRHSGVGPNRLRTWI